MNKLLSLTAGRLLWTAPKGSGYNIDLKPQVKLLLFNTLLVVICSEKFLRQKVTAVKSVMKEIIL